jgi:hypothetical protein
MPSTTENQLPSPHVEFAGRNNQDSVGKNSFREKAELFRPRNGSEDVRAATVARYALRLIDQTTGKAYTLSEIINQIADGVLNTDDYQVALVSGTNIKTVNNTSLLGSGNITITGSDLTSGPVTSENGISAIADGAIHPTKVEFLVASLEATENAINDLADQKLSKLEAEETYQPLENMASYQLSLVSGTNIRTVDAGSIVGSGNITTGGFPNRSGEITTGTYQITADDAGKLLWKTAGSTTITMPTAPTLTASHSTSLKRIAFQATGSSIIILPRSHFDWPDDIGGSISDPIVITAAEGIVTFEAQGSSYVGNRTNAAKVAKGPTDESGHHPIWSHTLGAYRALQITGDVNIDADGVAEIPNAALVAMADGKLAKFDESSGSFVDAVPNVDYLPVKSGTGSPNSAVTGSVGNIYIRTDGGPGTTFYVKESGAGTNTGWVAK